MKTKPIIIRVKPVTREKVYALAYSLGYKHGNTGSLSQLLDAIADNKLILSKNLSIEDKS